MSRRCARDRHEAPQSGTARAGATALLAALLLAACGPESAPPAGTAAAAQPAKAAAQDMTRATARPTAPTQPAVAAFDSGVIAAIQPITRSTSPTGAGAAVGGVLGAVIGHQVGGGDGKKIATAAGAVGGAVIGHQVEKDRSRTLVGYRIEVRMDDGSTRTFQPQALGGLAVGQRVQVRNGQLHAG
jgi:outer membrane lipoprotein SlyB